MKYILFIAAIILISILGYYLGQKFYQEKLSTNETTSQPLIAPLITEKTFSTFQPTVIIPSLPITDKTTINKAQANKTESETIQNKNTQNKTIQNETTQSETTIQSETTENKTIKNETTQNETIQNETTQANDNSMQSGTFYIQLGSFNSIENANSLKNQLKELGIEAKIEKIIQGNNETYRVVIGPYQSEEEALKESNKLKRIGFDNIVKSY